MLGTQSPQRGSCHVEGSCPTGFAGRPGVAIELGALAIFADFGGKLVLLLWGLWETLLDYTG